MVKKTLLLIVSLIIIFSVLEVGVRIWDPNGSIRLYQNDPLVGRTYKPNLDTKSLADDGSYAHLITNKYGFIGEDIEVEKPEGTLRITNHGDSFTSGHDVDYEKKYVTLLGQTMSQQLGYPVESLNFGIPSQGTQEAYLRYEHQARTFDPDIVVLYFFLGNDFDENLESLVSIEEKFARVDEGTQLRRIVKKSELALYVLNRLVRIQSTNHLMYRLGIIQEKGDFTVTQNKASKSEEVPKRWRLIFTPDEELNQEAINSTIEYLTLLKERVEGDGRKFAVVIIPRNAQVDREEKEKLLAEFPMLEELSFDTDRPNRELSSILDTLTIDYVDATPRFKEECVEDCRLYICNDCHLGIEGHKLISEITSQFLTERFFPHSVK